MLRSRSLVPLLVLSASLWGFVELADEVLEGETRELDSAILLSLRTPEDASDPVGPRWVEEMGRDFTALGGVALLVLLTGAVAGFLILTGKPRLAGVLFVAVGGGLLMSLALKSGFERPRPDLVPHYSHVYTTSFPSGHAMMSAVTYLTLGALLAGAFARHALKVYLLTLAVALTLAVGTSRVYLGVHWPTDVVAGWAAGLAWAIASWLVTHRLRETGAVEPEEDAGTG